MNTVECSIHILHKIGINKECISVSEKVYTFTVPLQSDPPKGILIKSTALVDLILKCIPMAQAAYIHVLLCVYCIGPVLY